MPIVAGEFEQRTEDEIRELLEDELIEQFGADIDLSRSSVFGTIIRVLATVIAENQEVDLADVYNAAFLETAEGEDLDKVVAILGIVRRSAQHSTGVQVFEREEKATSTYVIPSGTQVQTDGIDPIRFQTRRSTNIQLYDDFESGSLEDYSGIVSAFNINEDEDFVWTDTRSLEYVDEEADNGMYNTELRTRQGKKITVGILPQGDAVMRQLFGTQNTNNTYYTEYDHEEGTHSIYVREDGSDELLEQSTGHDLPEDEFTENIIDWSVDGQITSILVNDEGEQIDAITVSEDLTYMSGGYGFEGGSADTMYWDDFTSYSTAANIRAVEGGSDGNVGSNTLTVMPNVPSGVEKTYNPRPTGDPRFLDLDGEAYRLGEERETDSELRQRTEESVTEAGSSTVDAIASAVRNLDGVESVVVFENKTDEEDGDGQAPVSFETIVLGGDEQDIANTIYDKKAATARDVGGIRGESVTKTVRSDITGQDFEITFSRPNGIDIEIEMEIVITDEYIGDSDLRDLIVQYIGGTLSDETTVTGLTSGQDVKTDRVREVIVDGDNGVEGIVEISFTPATTTNALGLEVISIGDNEVATTDATDGSIQITTIQE